MPSLSFAFSGVMGLALLLASFSSAAQLSVDKAGIAATAPVEVYAGNFQGMPREPLRNHAILTYINTYDVNEAQTHYTGDDGFLRLQLPVGARVFFNLVGTADFTDTQTSIITIPAEGLTGQHRRVALQVPSVGLFELFKFLVNRKIESGTCQTVVTVTQYGKSYDVFPQGWPGIVATVSPANYINSSNINTAPFYFGTWGPFSNETNPLPNNLTSTSWDGGVLFANIPVNPNADFVIGAQYPGYNFSTSTFRCSKAGQFLNAAPNQGPNPDRPITWDSFSANGKRMERPPMKADEMESMRRFRM